MNTFKKLILSCIYNNVDQNHNQYRFVFVFPQSRKFTGLMIALYFSKEEGRTELGVVAEVGQGRTELSWGQPEAVW